MKIKSLLLAFPVLCLACSNPGSDTADPASQMDVSPLVAKQVAGVHTLTVDFNYDEPCNILGEEYVRSTFKLEETTTLEEGHEHGGCDFSWAGNKVSISFGSTKPYSSIYQAEYTFDKLYQGKPAEAMAPVDEAPATTVVTSSEGTNPDAIISDHTVSKDSTTNDNQPLHSGESAASHPLTKPAVSKGSFEAVPNVGDKAVWNAATGAMHVLYNNHIISVVVETKDKPEVKKQQAESLTEVIIEKIAENEYTSRM